MKRILCLVLAVLLFADMLPQPARAAEITNVVYIEYLGNLQWTDAGGTYYRVKLYDNATKEEILSLELTQNYVPVEEICPYTGTFYITVEALDGNKNSMSNVKQSNPFSFEDNSPPDITWPEGTEESAVRKSLTDATVTFVSHDEYSACSYYYAVVDAGGEMPEIDTSGAGTKAKYGKNTVTVTGLTAGEKDFYLVVKDQDGNACDPMMTPIPDYVTYTMTLSTGIGYSVVPLSGFSTTVEEGKSFRFTVQLSEGFHAPNGLTVKANGVVLTPENDIYTISSITVNQIIVVEGVEAKPGVVKYLVYATTSPLDGSGGTVSGLGEYTPGDHVTVTVTPDKSKNYCAAQWVSTDIGLGLVPAAEGKTSHTFTMPEQNVQISITFVQHSFTGIKDLGDGTHSIYCLTCGQVEKTEEHADSTGDGLCDVCGAQGSDSNHVHSFAALKNDDSGHWWECTCGRKTGAAAHDFDETNTCTVCDYHVHAKGNLNWNEMYHWYVCVYCTLEIRFDLHDDHDENRDTICDVCGAHAHVYSETWKSNSTNHWKECTCGSKMQEGAHVSTQEPTMDQGKLCDTCGYEMEPKIPSYRIILEQSEGGKLSASQERAMAGQTIQILAEPAEGYGFNRFLTGPDVALTYDMYFLENEEAGYRAKFQMPAKDVTVRALFTDKSSGYKITLLDSTAVDIRYVPGGARWPLPNFPYEKEDYTFAGWLCQEDNKTYQPGDYVTVNSSLTFDSKWKAVGLDINETNFPDVLFRSLVQQTFDGDADWVLSDKEIDNATSLTGSGAITSLKGIEHLTNLTVLKITGASLTEIDLSANTKLTDLNLRKCQLTALDLSKNTALNALCLSDNQLTALDLSANTDLNWLNLEHNQLTSLNVGTLKDLLILTLSDNQLREIDLTNLEHLSDLALSGNQLTTLDLSGKTNLNVVELGRQTRTVTVARNGLWGEVSFHDLGVNKEYILNSSATITDDSLHFPLNASTVTYRYKVPYGVPQMPKEGILEVTLNLQWEGAGLVGVVGGTGVRANVYDATAYILDGQVLPVGTVDGAGVGAGQVVFDPSFLGGQGDVGFRFTGGVTVTLPADTQKVIQSTANAAVSLGASLTGNGQTKNDDHLELLIENVANGTLNPVTIDFSIYSLADLEALYEMVVYRRFWSLGGGDSIWKIIELQTILTEEIYIRKAGCSVGTGETLWYSMYVDYAVGGASMALGGSVQYRIDTAGGLPLNTSVYQVSPSGTRTAMKVTSNDGTSLTFLDPGNVNPIQTPGSAANARTSATYTYILVSPKPQYKITFDAAGGTVSPGTLTTTGDNTLQSLPTPYRWNYVFNGWYTAKSGGQKVTTDTVFVQDTTVYAQWTYRPADSDSPKTGDTTHSGLWLTLATLGLAGLTASLAAKKRRR